MGFEGLITGGRLAEIEAILGQLKAAESVDSALSSRDKDLLRENMNDYLKLAIQCYLDMEEMIHMDPGMLVRYSPQQKENPLPIMESLVESGLCNISDALFEMMKTELKKRLFYIARQRRNGRVSEEAVHGITTALDNVFNNLLRNTPVDSILPVIDDVKMQLWDHISRESDKEEFRNYVLERIRRMKSRHEVEELTASIERLWR